MAKWPFKFAIISLIASIILFTRVLISIQPAPSPQSAKRCDNLPLNNFVHPIHYIVDTPSTTPAPVLSQFVPSVIVNPTKFCDFNQSYNVIFVVHSNASHSERRNYLREHVFTWLFLRKMNARVVFVVGLIGEKTADEETMEEAAVSKDMLVANVVENYHNITYKAQAWVRYLTEKCTGKIRYVLKLDDDVLFDEMGVQFLLHRYRQQKRFVACRVFPSGVIVRNPLSKWYLSKEEFPGSDLGLYCQGMAYLFTADLLPQLNASIESAQFLWMDDWYVTHSLMTGANALFLDISTHIVSTNSKIELQDYLHRRSAYKAMPRAIFAHFRPAKSFPLEERLQIWDQIQTFQKCENAPRL